VCALGCKGTHVYGDFEGDADRREHTIGARNRDPQCTGGNCEPELTDSEISSSRGEKWHEGGTPYTAAPHGQKGKLHMNSTGSIEHFYAQGRREQV